jgi:hypothetical protein
MELLLIAWVVNTSQYTSFVITLKFKIKKCMFYIIKLSNMGHFNLNQQMHGEFNYLP